jgi:hypothetical protein
MGVETMTERKSAESDFSAPVGRRYLLIGLALLGMVVAILAGAFVLSDRLKPRVDTTPVQAATTKGAEATPIAAPALATSLPAPVPAAAASLEAEIEEAYLRYWDVRAEALLNQDPSRLSEVMAGAELTRTRQQIAELKAQGKAAKIIVEHRIAFLEVGETDARLYDEYFNKSYLVDAQSKQPLQAPGPGGVAKVSYQLRKIDGTWRVIDGMRHD